MSALEKKRYDCTALPKGWQREEITRKSGLSAGKVDVCYYSPEGQKFESKPQLVRAISDTVDLTAFDFSTGKCNNSLLVRRHKKPRANQFDYSSRGMRNDASLVPPIRQTASIFKQPVTLYRTQEGKTKSEFGKHGNQEKPKQLFWEKRLEGLRASDIDGSELKGMELPRNLKSVGPNVNDETLLQSMATALHVLGQPITGQLGAKASLEKNPGVYLNPEQPLVQAVSITEEDIKRQEERVNLARKRLEDAMKELEG
ncbi:methyl-CpG-binding domain protein 2 isoform X1 [Cimex lectularius]|uniref:MBD domain-containing protein n=1 Tax=Cimex lectularius TaxID=79782 RepID=A0A8I6SF96_CIMLE|nr:methyl-CpG-binding domain protein 2 isoform X1 [Cimex lectularius]